MQGHVLILGTVIDVQQLDLANGRADRGDIQAVFVLQVSNFGDLGLGQFHHVLDAVAGIDEADAVELQAKRRERRKLLDSRLVVGSLVGKTR